ncbi:MAG: tail-specific protease, partial [Dokdonella sp.]
TPALDPSRKTVEKVTADVKDEGSGRKTTSEATKATMAVAAADPKNTPDATKQAKDLASAQDDGLQADERSVASDLKREKEEKSKRDVVLDEAAHVLADEVGIIRTDTKLAQVVLPHGVIVQTETN